VSRSGLPFPSPEFISHLCIPCSESFPDQHAPPCTASFKTPKRRPVASLMLSRYHIRGFPCLLYPATCPSIMSCSSGPFTFIMWPRLLTLIGGLLLLVIFQVSLPPKLKVSFLFLSTELVKFFSTSIAQRHQSFSFPFSSPSSSHFCVSLLEILPFLLF